jgi:hypothetical protein
MVHSRRRRLRSHGTRSVTAVLLTSPNNGLGEAAGERPVSINDVRVLFAALRTGLNQQPIRGWDVAELELGRAALCLHR